VRGKLKNIFLKIIQHRLLQHLAFWSVSLIVLVSLTRVSAEIKTIDWVYGLVFHLVLLLPVYINLFILIPRQMAKNRYALYLLSLALNLALGIGFYYFVFGFVVDWILPGYYFVAVYDVYEIGAILLAYLVFTLLLKLARAWFLVSKIEKESTRHQLEALKSQVNPHFLFNTLSTVYSLSRKKSDFAPGVILQLSDIMRYMLYETNADRVELIKELEVIGNIFSIHEMRVGEAITIEKHIQGDITDVKVAPLLFVSFVENAIKHCRPLPNGKFFIRMAFAVDGNNLQFSIENSYEEAGEPVIENGGIGLQNARKRLSLLYPYNHYLTINSEGNVFKVELRLKFN
jgi:sensor histidine kinase YesM